VAINRQAIVMVRNSLSINTVNYRVIKEDETRLYELVGLDLVDWIGIDRLNFQELLLLFLLATL